MEGKLNSRTQHNTIQHNTIQYNTIQHNTIQPKLTITNITIHYIAVISRWQEFYVREVKKIFCNRARTTRNKRLKTSWKYLFRTSAYIRNICYITFSYQQYKAIQQLNTYYSSSSSRPRQSF